MKVFNKVDPEFINKIPGDYVADILEGSLIDNLLFYCGENVMLAAVETYQNCWTSLYRVFIGNEDEVYELWDELRAEVDPDVKN